MTDLEKHWDDLPVGPAPVDAILRRARRESGAARGAGRPEARLKRSLTTVAVLGGVAAAFVAGTLVPDAGGSDGPGPGGLGGDLATPVAFSGALQAAGSCDELLQHYVDRSVDLVSRYGWGQPGYELKTQANWNGDEQAFLTRGGVMPADAGGAFQESADARGTTELAGTVRGKPSDTGTNVQETGVDEPDNVKADGSLLVRLRGAELTTYDVSGDELEELGRLDLGDFHDGQILLAGDTVVALGNDGARPTGVGDRYGQQVQQTRVLSVSIADPAAPTLEQTVDYDAALVAARQHGTDVRVVVAKGLPDLDFTEGSDAASTNRAVVEESTIDDWLPHVSVDGGEPTQLVDCERVALPRAELTPATMAVVGFGAAAPGELSTLGLAGDAPLTYESSDHLYLAASAADTSFGGCFECFRRTTAPGSASGASDGTTHVYDFTLDGTGATYVGAGEVEGSIRDRWSMDEYDGVLRVAVGPSTETADANSIVTMRIEDDELVEVGRIDGLGKREDIQAVRWFDGLALVVTFRQIDPLYAVDLTDPTTPVLRGELKIPGFSSYLHPLGTKRVLGVGTDARGRAQAGFFDVTDLTDVRRLDVVTYARGTHARAGDDPRQFTWVPEERVALTVIARGNVGYVSTLRIDEGTMTNEMTEVEFGRDVDAVRLVPVGEGRVVLVTGEDVEFFDLS